MLVRHLPFVGSLRLHRHLRRQISKRCLSPVLCLLISTVLAFSVTANDFGLVIPKGKGEQCVAETDFMRRNHMDLIMHQRDETVIRGIRDEPFSLSECVDCHVQQDANKAYIRVDAEGQFCASCHTYVAAKIDCFSCHAAVPDTVVGVVEGNRVGHKSWTPHKSLLAFRQSHKASLP